MDRDPIKVAIVGGGLGGTILMNALTKYRQLDVQLYEAKDSFKERGASVGLMENAQRALRLLGMGGIVKRARAVELEKFRICLGEGVDTPETIIDLPEGLETVHRATLLKELMTTIPSENVHFGKGLESINGNTLTFKDGSSATADVIIGADGIHSTVRKCVLGEGHPAIEPVYAGFWDCRAVMPADIAIEKLGSAKLDRSDPVQHAYVGNQVWFMHDLIEDGTLACVIAAGPTPSDWDKTQWKRLVSRAWLDGLSKKFGEFGSKVLDLLFDGKDEIPAFVQWASADAPTFHNGSICMIGDAAHATTPWLGSGLAVSIEDSLILQSVLGKCQGVEEVPAAFEVYQSIMKPRGQKIIDASQEHGYVNTGAKGLDVEVLADYYSHVWDFITKWDTEKAVESALSDFERLRPSANGCS